MSRRTVMEAVYEKFGGQATTLYADALAGAQSIELTASLPVGAIELDVTTDAAETVYATGISGTGPYTYTLRQPLNADHTAGGIASGFSTSPAVIDGVQTVVRGNRVLLPTQLQPVLAVVIDGSEEYRYGGKLKVQGLAQMKFVDYDVTLLLGNVGAPGNDQDGAPRLLDQFYGWLDDISARIRADKVLVTPSFPQGAVIRWGEEFQVRNPYALTQSEVKIVASITVSCTEQVQA